MTLNLTQVRAFVTVIEAGGFLEAARRLAISQPAVTQLVRKLETQLGAQLVLRDRRGAAATPDGALLLPHARTLLQAEARAVAAIAGRSLTVGASGNVGTYLLPPLLRSFRDAERIETDLVIAQNPEILNHVAAGSVDVAVVEWWDGRPGLTARAWRREPLAVIVPPDHPWAGFDHIEPDRLFEVPLIGGEPGSGTGRLLQETYGPDASRLRVAMSLGSTAAVKEAVKAGLGISLVLRSCAQAEIQAGTLRALDLRGAPLAKELMMVMPEHLPPTAPAARFGIHLGTLSA